MKENRINFRVSHILTDPERQWTQFRNASSGKIRTAFRELDVDWKKYNTKDYLFTHDTACCSVATESNGYWITPPCWELVNANGNAWTTPVLLASFKTFIGGDNFLEHCFAKGTRVLMADGTYKPIDGVNPGEKVINRLGQVDTVKNVQIRHSSDLYEIESNGLLSKKMIVTGNHPFYVVDCKKNGNDVLLPNDESTAQWVEAGNLDASSNMLTTPVIDTVIENNEINANRAELIGWFLAEGNFTYKNKFHEGASGIQMAFSAKERDKAERMKELLTVEFGDEFRKGSEPRIYTCYYNGKESSLSLMLCNIKAAEFFYKYCGEHSWSKKMDESLLYIDKELQKIILKSLFEGDGHFKNTKRSASIELVSEKLVQQIKFISNRLGMNPTYCATKMMKRYDTLTIVDGYEVYIDSTTGKKKRPSYKLSYSSNNSLLFKEKTSGKNAKKVVSFGNGEGNWLLNKFSIAKLDNSTEQEVYNLEVENDNSYIAEGVVVHNCQIPALSKGKILDAVARPVVHHSEKYGDANIYYVDVLVATDRKHTSLIERIESGKLNTLSMGTLAEVTQCSICGKRIYDGDKNCEHLDRYIGQMVTCSDGKDRICSELCGACDDHGDYIEGSNSFIELSWVEHPAFKGAVVNSFIETEEERELRENSKNDLEKLFSENLFERLRVADRDTNIALKITRDVIKEDRIAEKIAKKLDE